MEIQRSVEIRPPKHPRQFKELSDAKNKNVSKIKNSKDQEVEHYENKTKLSVINSNNNEERLAENENIEYNENSLDNNKIIHENEEQGETPHESSERSNSNAESKESNENEEEKEDGSGEEEENEEPEQAEEGNEASAHEGNDNEGNDKEENDNEENDNENENEEGEQEDDEEDEPEHTISERDEYVQYDENEAKGYTKGNITNGVIYEEATTNTNDISKPVLRPCKARKNKFVTKSPITQEDLKHSSKITPKNDYTPCNDDHIKCVKYKKYNYIRPAFYPFFTLEGRDNYFCFSDKKPRKIRKVFSCGKDKAKHFSSAKKKCRINLYNYESLEEDNKDSSEDEENEKPLYFSYGPINQHFSGHKYNKSMMSAKPIKKPKIKLVYNVDVPYPMCPPCYPYDYDYPHYGYGYEPHFCCYHHPRPFNPYYNFGYNDGYYVNDYYC